MPPAAGLNNTGNPSCKIIPKHLYDVNKIFPPGVGLCSIKHGPDNSLPKETKDWLSKVAFKMMYLQLNSKLKCQINTEINRKSKSPNSKILPLHLHFYPIF